MRGIDIINESLKEYFNKHGYKGYPGPPKCYIRNEQDLIMSTLMLQYHRGALFPHIGMPSVVYGDVRKIIHQVGTARLGPQNKILEFNKKYCYSDIRWVDWIGARPHTKAELNQSNFMEKYIKQIESVGFPFLDHYKNPLNFLKHLNKHQDNIISPEEYRQSGWHSPDLTLKFNLSLTWMMVFCKLCDDPRYDEKLDIFYRIIDLPKLYTGDIPIFKEGEDGRFYFDKYVKFLKDQPPIYAEKYTK